MRVDDNYGGALGYEPNSDSKWKEQPEFREPPLNLEGSGLCLVSTKKKAASMSLQPFVYL